MWVTLHFSLQRNSWISVTKWEDDLRGALGQKEFVLENAFIFLKFDRLKPKIGCSSSINKRWTCASLFDVQKNGVGVHSMFRHNSANLVKAF